MILIKKKTTNTTNPFTSEHFYYEIVPLHSIFTTLLINSKEFWPVSDFDTLIDFPYLVSCYP